MSEPGTSEASPPSLLSLPLEIRHLIFSYAIAPTIILPCTPRSTSLRRRSTSLNNSFQHPSPGNPLIYGIANVHSRWRIPSSSSPGSAKNGNDNNTTTNTQLSTRSRVFITPYIPLPLPAALALANHQLHAELTSFALTSGLHTFAFSSFESLIKFIKHQRPRHGSDAAATDFLSRIGSVLLELTLDVTPSTDPHAPDGVPEAQEPWFDALKLLRRACPRIHTLGVRAELTGPEIQVVHFGALPQAMPADGGGATGLFGFQAASDATPPPPPPTDWPPGREQRRADFGPTIGRIADFVEGFAGLRRCGVTVDARHTLRNLAADPGDGSLWARSSEVAVLGAELVGRIRGLEKLGGATGDGTGNENGNGKGEDRRMGMGIWDGVLMDLGEARARRLAEEGREQYWY